MAIEALRQSRDRDFLSREESGNFITATKEAITEQGFEQDNSRDDGAATNNPARKLNLTSVRDLLNNHMRLAGLRMVFSLCRSLGHSWVTTNRNMTKFG